MSSKTPHRSQAIADFTTALRLKPDHAEAYFCRGHSYDHKGELDQAIADYDEAIRCKPDYAEAYNNRGIDYKEKGELNRAAADLDKSKGLNANAPRN